MSEFRVAYRYAKSLLGLSQEQGSLEEVHQDMQLLGKVTEENRDLWLMLRNPIIHPSKKLEVLNAVFAGKISTLTQEFFKIIARKHREAYLPAIAKEFHVQYNAAKGIAAATVTTTFPLTDDLRAQFIGIVKEISGKEVELSEAVDADLVGGFVLRVGDRQIDESISSKFKKLKTEFSSNTYVKEI